jgi:hypothetical protein
MNRLTSKQIQSMHAASDELSARQASPSFWTRERTVLVRRKERCGQATWQSSGVARCFIAAVICCIYGIDLPSLQAQSQFTQTSTLDESDTRSITKANFLFHFAASNEWPAQCMEGPFRLAIIGNPSLHAILSDKYAMKSIGFEDVASLESAPFVHVIYCEESGAKLQQVANAIANAPVLLISDASDGLQNGALINFVSVNNRIRFEINSEEAAKRDLLIGNRILSWAVK